MLRAHEMEVMIPDDHRLVVELPETVRTGRARLILLESPREEGDATPPQGRGRMAALYRKLAAEKPFRELSTEERHARLRQVKGIGRGLLSTSEEFERQKREEVELEERKFAC